MLKFFKKRLSQHSFRQRASANRFIDQTIQTTLKLIFNQNLLQEVSVTYAAELQRP